MACKNCNTALDSKINFCSNCGAKTIRNRLTLKTIWVDINEEFISIDNKFFKTFIHLFTKPETVINEFINGTRKTHISVIQYFAISLTLVGIQVFLMNTFFKDALDIDFPFMDAFNTSESQKNNPFSSINLEQYNNYQSVFYILSVPISAISTWIAYWIAGKREFNFTEHLVINLYYSAQVVIITSVLNILFLCLGINYYVISTFVSLFTFAYLFYILKRVFNTRFLETLSYFFLVMIAFGFVFIVIMILALIFGIIITLIKKA
ncbi:hypothetical protein A9Q86_16190 [Flavobacteriales bacterium 33_180_T64]|nr:hypothetical protein A9Q86_16190 [Flavobacteriales bacterium 33_180_T64]